MMTAVNLTTSCNVAGEQGEKIVIEGELANVPDSMFLNLLEDVGQMLPIMDGDTVLGGKFRFEGISDDGGVNPAHILYAKTGLFTQHSLWVMPGARVKITGDGMDYSAWEIESNVPAQKTENKFRANTRKELGEYTHAYEEYYRTGDEKYYWQADSLLCIVIPRKDIALLETLPVDEAWMDHLFYLAISKDTALLAKGKELAQRMSEEQKTSYRGRRIMNKLYPQAVKMGDMLPDLELKDTLGNVHRLQELKGKYLLLDFWSSGCGPCIMSFPELKEISEQMADSLEVVSISQDGEKYWKEASAKHNITWHNWNDLQKDNGIFARFGVKGIPDYFLVSPEGKVIANKGGYGKGSLKPFVLLNIEKAGKQPACRTEGSKRIIDYPTVTEEHISTMYIRRVELTDKETAVTFRVFYPSSQWFRISDESHLITDSGEKLPIRSATNISLNKRCYTPESNVMEFTLHFPALPAGTASFSYYEEENKPNDCWRMIGVKVKE